MEKIIASNYKIVEVIGKGGMSTVYKVEHIEFGTILAIKQVSKNQHIKFDFLAEANILMKLEHPMLPKIVDVVEDDDFLYVVEEYIEGKNLKEILKKVEKISEDVGVKWFEEIAECLSYLHSQKPNPIIYRDMKPSNIMVQEDGSLKLIDFGIAREFKSDATDDTTYIGTKGYAAPEQAGKTQSDARTDIYGLGVTMYHLLSGKSPYDLNNNFVPIRQLNPNLSKGIEHILLKCLQKDSQKRYQTCGELINDLKNIDKFDDKYISNRNKNKLRYTAVAVMLFFSIVLIGLGFSKLQTAKEEEFNYLLSDAYYYSINDPEKSLEKLNEINGKIDDDTYTYIFAKATYYAEGDFQECINYINDYLQQDKKPTNRDVIYGLLGSTYSKIGDYASAIESFEKVSNLNTEENIHIMADYAVSLAKVDRMGEAIEALEQVDEIDEYSLESQYIRAILNLLEGNIDSAKDNLKEIVEHNISDYNGIIYNNAFEELFNIYINDTVSQENLNEINNLVEKNKSKIVKYMELYALETRCDALYLIAADYTDSVEDYQKAATCLNEIIIYDEYTHKYLFNKAIQMYFYIQDYYKVESLVRNLKDIYPDAYEVNGYNAKLMILRDDDKENAYFEYLKAKEKITPEDDDFLLIEIENMLDINENE